MTTDTTDIAGTFYIGSTVVLGIVAAGALITGNLLLGIAWATAASFAFNAYQAHERAQIQAEMDRIDERMAEQQR